jgi:hypothetical protein
MRDGGWWIAGCTTEEDSESIVEVFCCVWVHDMAAL